MAHSHHSKIDRRVGKDTRAGKRERREARHALMSGEFDAVTTFLPTHLVRTYTRAS